MQEGTFFFSIAEATVAVSTARNVKKKTLRFRGDIEFRVCQWFSQRLFYTRHSYYMVLGGAWQQNLWKIATARAKSDVFVDNSYGDN